MNISSNYSNYYYTQKQYSLNALSNAQLSGSESAGSTDSKTSAVSASTSSSTKTSGYGNVMNLSFNGRMMKASLLEQGADNSEMAGKMAQMRTDMDALKTADIDSMSADEVKATLTQLKTDMEAMPKPGGESQGAPEINVDSMSETEMRDMLKNIQVHEKNRPAEGAGRPPMMGGMPGMQSDMSASGSDSDTESILQQILDKLTESYDSSTQSSDDYIEKLKESLQAMISQQQSKLDSYSNMMLDQSAASDNTKRTGVQSA